MLLGVALRLKAGLSFGWCSEVMGMGAGFVLYFVRWVERTWLIRLVFVLYCAAA